jgi:cytochrome-b5 reductase
MSRATLVSAFAAAGVGAYYSIRSAHAESSEPPKVFGGLGFTTLRLKDVQQVNHNTKRLSFEFLDPHAQSGLTPISALLTVSWPNGRWLPVLRPYTPISPLDQRGGIELLVKKYPNGKGSTHLHSLVPGDKLTFAAALKGFPWKPNQFSQVFLIAGGAGITPIYQLIQGILNNPKDKTRIKLVFGVHTEQDVLLKKELDEYRERFPDRFEYLYTVSHPVGKDTAFRKGYITEDLLKDVVGGPNQNAKIFICGPPGLEESLVGSKGTQGILARLGFTKDQIYRF